MDPNGRTQGLLNAAHYWDRRGGLPSQTFDPYLRRHRWREACRANSLMRAWRREYRNAVARVTQRAGRFTVVVVWPHEEKTQLVEAPGSLEQAQHLADTLAGVRRDTPPWTPE